MFSKLEIVKSIHVDTPYGDSYFNICVNANKNTFHVEQTTVSLNSGTRAINEALLYEGLFSRTFIPSYSKSGKLYCPIWENVRPTFIRPIILQMKRLDSVTDEVATITWFHCSGVFLRVMEFNDDQPFEYSIFADGKPVRFKFHEMDLRLISSLLAKYPK